MKMKKTLVFVAGAAGTTTLLLRNEELRQSLRNKVRQVRSYLSNTPVKDKVEKKSIGHSRPYDYADNKMVSEGALTSVEYYNKAQQESR